MQKSTQTPLKISIVVHDLKGGGAEKMMVRLANGLSMLGDHVEMVLLTSGGVNKTLVSDNVNIVELNSSRTMSSIPKLVRYLKANKPDKIISALTHVNVIATIACAWTGNLDKLNVSERNAFSRDKHVNPETMVKVAYFLAPYLYRWQPNPVICVSQGVAEDLCQCTTVRMKDTTTAPNPVLDNDFETKTFNEAKHPWLANKEKPVIVAAGRLANQKGFDVLINAFAEVQKEVDSRLVIFGEGELRADFEHQIEALGLNDCVDLPGYSDQVMSEMAAASVFVLSSRFEGSPNVLVEAMSTGVPVVATDCPCGPEEILCHGRVAPLIDMENVSMLKEAIMSQLGEDDKRAIRIEAIKRFTSENSAKAYRALLCR